jgi:hypothetical protein
MNAEIKEKGVAPGWIWMVLIATCLLLAIFGGIKSCNDNNKKAVEKSKAEKVAAEKFNAAHPPAPAAKQTEALVLEKECLTPCSANIAWKFKIRTDGRPLRIKFQGVHDEVSYPGEGDFQVPPEMTSGETTFISSDNEHPHVRVQVYRRISLPR